VRIAALCTAVALGVLVAGCSGDDPPSSTPTETAIAKDATASTSANESVADVVERVLTGVVNLKTIGFDGSEGEASGVVIDRRGVIVTSNHVVQGARTITISFNDGRHTESVTGEVIGTAPERDLAIIQVRLDDLMPVALGSSSKLRLGDSVLAIGFPLGLGGGPTVTQGIVSGLDRTIQPEGSAALEGLLQTDAAINPGNSGGALVDAAGRLVGINTAAARAGSAENVGFAIAIDEARPVIDEIRSKPADQRAWLGVTLDVIDTPAAAAQLGLPPETRGAAVIGSFSDSPAARAGLRPGDVIVSIDGRPVRSTEEISKTVRDLDPGDSLSLDVVDQSGPRRVSVTVGKRPQTLPSGG
jgi:S1-C subfamily serine protease